MVPRHSRLHQRCQLHLRAAFSLLQPLPQSHPLILTPLQEREQEGLFRKSGSRSRVRTLFSIINGEKEVPRRMRAAMSGADSRIDFPALLRKHNW